MLYREIEVEKYWDIPSTDPRKKEKIRNAILTGNYGATIKKDGEHIRAIYDTDGEIYILGRGTNAKEIHNLNKHLVFITEWLRTNFTPGTCIFGELYVPGKTSRAIRAYTGSLVPKSLKNQKDCPPKYYVFDAWALSGIDLMQDSYASRISLLSDIMKTFLVLNTQIEIAKVITGSQEILDFIAESFEKGEEGVVLVDLNSIPAPGKRTAWKSIKVKKEFQNNIDCFFTGNWRPPTREYNGTEVKNWKYWEDIHQSEDGYHHILFGDYYNDYFLGRPIEPVTRAYALDWPGSLEVGVYKGTQIVPICYISGISDELKEQFAIKREEVVLRPIAITGMEATDKSIRHPKFVGFRDDISLDDCTWDKIFGEEG